MRPAAPEAAPPGASNVVAAARPCPDPLLELGTVTLAELDERAALLERQDRKYIVRRSVLEQALSRWADGFDILAIDGRRSFLYDNCYFDDLSLRSFRQHHQGRRIRYKVRTRRYVEDDLCFVEIKLKGPRGATVKKRRRYPSELFGTLNDDAWEHIRSAYAEMYQRDFPGDLAPSLRMRFRRATLVARSGAERITLDSELEFSCNTARQLVDADRIIVETKSASAVCSADRVLRDLRQRPVARCSKYCIGLALLHRVERFNKFQAAMRQLDHTLDSRLRSVLGRAHSLYGSEVESLERITS